MSTAISLGVVVHLDEADRGKHASVLRNVSNLMDAFGPETEVELVVHGAGITAVLRDGEYGEHLRALQERGLTVAACGNTLRSEGIEPERLLPGAVIVPSGIAHLVIRQREGWAYLRP